MHVPRTIVLCGLVIALAVVGWRLADTRLVREDELARAAVTEAREAEVRRKLEADAALEKEARRVAFEAEIRRREEAERALGGPLDAIVKEPGLTIQEMLRRLAVAVSPAGASVSVQVERFTEFLIHIDLPDTAGYDEMAGWSREILRRTHRYVHLLRWIREGIVIGEIDRREIESVKDWEAAPASTLATLVRNAPEVETGVGEMSAREVDLSGGGAAEPEFEADPRDEGTRMGEVNRRFNELLRARVNTVTNLLTEIGRAVNLAPLQAAASAQAEVDRIDKAAREFQGLRAFFRNPAAEMDRLLREAGLEGEFRTATLRGFSARYAATLQAERLFNSLADYCAALQRFVRAMRESRALWSVSGDGLRVEFTDPGADFAYQKAMKECERGRDKAIQAWMDWAHTAWTGEVGAGERK
jgi:hypothetical protein